jgi:hypothetical protein
LGLIPQAMFGPPERCYYTTVSDIPALLVNRHGRGACAVFPWDVGAHYARQQRQQRFEALVHVGRVRDLRFTEYTRRSRLRDIHRLGLCRYRNCLFHRLEFEFDFYLGRCPGFHGDLDCVGSQAAEIRSEAVLPRWDFWKDETPHLIGASFEPEGIEPV